ncbi:MAG: recombinase family protein [Candidatus Thermoplasmatota archaeon]|nr:recombinase family protein [Candidatus Thermoplasmatota archaeon]
MNDKVALYSRVSTQDQNPEMQKKALIEKAEREGWDYELFVEKESTRKTRPIKYQLYQRLLKKEFEAVVVWKIDRWARSVQELLREVTTLYERGVKFISLTDSIDLSSASGMLQFNVMASFAQFERDIISERTKEGLKHARNVGKRGRDKKPRRKSGYYLRYARQKNGGMRNG